MLTHLKRKTTKLSIKSESIYPEGCQVSSCGCLMFDYCGIRAERGVGGEDDTWCDKIGVTQTKVGVELLYIWLIDRRLIQVS